MDVESHDNRNPPISLDLSRINEQDRNVYQNNDSVPHKGHKRKYVTFSVSASKDFRFSLIKKHDEPEFEQAEDTSKIIEILTQGLKGDITPLELFSSLYG